MKSSKQLYGFCRICKVFKTIVWFQCKSQNNCMVFRIFVRIVGFSKEIVWFWLKFEFYKTVIFCNFLELVINSLFDVLYSFLKSSHVKNALMWFSIIQWLQAPSIFIIFQFQSILFAFFVILNLTKTTN